MEPSDTAVLSAPRPTHGSWAGVLLSLLIPGAGIFLAGNRKGGVRWFLVVTLVSWLTIVAASLPFLHGLSACVVFASLYGLLVLCMLVLSWKRIPKLGVWRWLVFLLLAGVLGTVDLIGMEQLTQPFKLPTGSMEPTLQPGDKVFVQTSAYWFRVPKRGEVIVFRTDALEFPGLPKGQFFIKRVAALPGETLQIANGRLLINQQPLQSPTVLAGNNFDMPFIVFPDRSTNTYVVPAGSYYVVGDNGANSLDSRHFGAVPRAGIIGRATKIYWPRLRVGDIR